jgi:hypothetical protein
MYHSCRKLGEMCPGKQHETGYYQHRSIVQKMQNHDFLWLLPFVVCVLVLFPVAFQKRKRTNTKSQIQFLRIKPKRPALQQGKVRENSNFKTEKNPKKTMQVSIFMII